MFEQDFILLNQQYALMEKWKRKIRSMYRIKHNKPTQNICYNDMLSTSDFRFYNHKNDGDSGNMLIAKRKGDSSEQYFVKHAYHDCACNEYLYYKLGSMLGLRIPETKLFTISENDKRNIFGTEYVVGSRNIEILPKPSIEEIAIHPDWYNQYTTAFALWVMFCEDDDFDVNIGADGLMYRIDTTASFGIDNFIVCDLGVDDISDDREISLHEVSVNKLKKIIEFFKNREFRFSDRLEMLNNTFGFDCTDAYIKPMKSFMRINNEDVTPLIETIAYIYTSELGEYYLKFLDLLRIKISEYLAQLKGIG